MDSLPANIPANIRSLLESIIESFKTALADNLMGVYLHGSAAMGCFNPVKSDIDLLIVVKEQLTTDAKRAIIRFILQFADQATRKGLELSVVTRDALQHFQYPTPYELHFGNEWKERYILDKVDFEQQRFDADLAAHFMVARRRGIRLYGEPIQAVFPVLADEYYLRSIVYDAQDILDNITNDPVYGVLNLCRVLAFIRDKAVLSKLEGGQWGIEHLPKEYQPLIQMALQVYQSTADGDVEWDNVALQAFCDYTKHEIDPTNPHGAA